MLCNVDPRQLRYLAGILCNGYLPAKNRKTAKTEKVMVAPLFLS